MDIQDILFEHMIYGSIGLLFALAVLTVYALIQLGRNNVLTFFLIPLALVASIYTSYTLFALQGTPINSLPEGNVEVVWVEVQKPEIFFTVRHFGKTEPTYYVIPYTTANAKEMDRLLKAMMKGQRVEGQFQKGEPDTGDLSHDPDRIHFDDIERHPLPEKKQVLRESGVSSRMADEIHNQEDEGSNVTRNYDGEYSENDIP